MTAPLVIIGAGQAGLATAYAARRAGLTPVVLEARPAAGGSWPDYYYSLALFSPARYSALPGRPFPGDPDRYPTRDEVVAYLRDYAGHLDVDLRYGHRVDAVTAGPDGLTVATASGTTVTTPLLVAATGGFGRPHVPDLPGLSTFSGAVLHSSAYREPGALRGARVVVVGGGNSAVQIAAELARTARVTLATRTPLRWTTQRPLGRDVHWWLAVTGLDTVPIGHHLTGRAVQVLDDGRYRAALATGNPDRRPLFERLDGDRVVWADGRTERVDAVVLATGYRPDLDVLAGTGALDRDGRPLHRHGLSRTVPGLGYVGLEHQRSFSSATVRGVGRDAEHVLRHLRPARSVSVSPAGCPGDPPPFRRAGVQAKTGLWSL